MHGQLLSLSASRSVLLFSRLPACLPGPALSATALQSRRNHSARGQQAAPAAAMGAGLPPPPPFVLGLTGSIGMGKTTVAGFLHALAVPVLDSDAVVHELYGPGGAAVAPVGALFPSALAPDGGISRPALGPLVLGPGKEAAMASLEAAVHPLVAARRDAFVAAAREAGEQLVVIDVPLLYETKREADCHAVAVVSTGDAAVQRQRVLARPGMTEEKLEGILARQIPDTEKRARADFVIETGRGLDETRTEVEALVKRLRDPQLQWAPRAGKAGS